MAEALRLTRFDLKFSNGTLPHEQQLASIERYGSVVAPLVREGLAEGARRSTLEDGVVLSG